MQDCINFRLPLDGRLWTVVPSISSDVPNQWFLRSLSAKHCFSLLLLLEIVTLAVCSSAGMGCWFWFVLHVSGNGQICFAISGLFFKEFVPSPQAGHVIEFLFVAVVASLISPTVTSWNNSNVSQASPKPLKWVIFLASVAAKDDAEYGLSLPRHDFYSLPTYSVPERAMPPSNRPRSKRRWSDWLQAWLRNILEQINRAVANLSGCGCKGLWKSKKSKESRWLAEQCCDKSPFSVYEGLAFAVCEVKKIDSVSAVNCTSVWWAINSPLDVAVMCSQL